MTLTAGYPTGQTMSAATVAKNIIVAINGTKIAEIDDAGIPLPIALTEDIEVTNQDSGNFKEYKQGRRDGGECDITGNYVPSDPGQIALYNAANLGTIDTYNVYLPSGSYWTFTALSKSFATEIKNKMVMFTAKVKVTGQPTISQTKAALTTPFFAVATSTGILPAASATDGTYVVSVATGTASVTVTPTDVNTGAVITVNGTQVATGAASGAITLGGSGTVTPIIVMVSEPTKATVMYNLLVQRP